MDIIFGRYRARVEKNGLVLTHPAKISFDMTLDEALKLLDILRNYEQTLTELQSDSNSSLEHMPATEKEIGQLLVYQSLKQGES